MKVNLKLPSTPLSKLMHKNKYPFLLGVNSNSSVKKPQALPA